MSGGYRDKFPFRSHTAQPPSYLLPDARTMIVRESMSDWSSQLLMQYPQQQEDQEGQWQQQKQPLGVPTDSLYNNPYPHPEQYQLDNQFYDYQMSQVEQQRQQQQFQFYQHQYQHEQFSNRNNPNHQSQGDTSPRRLTLPRLDTSSPAVQPRTQRIKPPRFYANLQLNTPASTAAATSIPPSPGATPQTPFKSALHQASFSPFPDPESASTFASVGRRPPLAVPQRHPTSVAAVSTPATTPSSSQPAFPKRMQRIDRTQAPSLHEATKPRTFFGGIVSSSRKGRRVVKKQKSIPSLSDAGVVAQPKRELKRSQSMFGLLGRLVRREK
ncbi:hypothetical protein ACJ72_06177 [Emergomyces africanus]|uniref:Uncharacterized protein n=1 Tax=Emergomyces africanus TaxID=1955775 RepID=A0A1B7NRV0_9EURO|nr:hypothetical protein ACJ72_06177 [Emergomyces africanus]